MLSRLGLKASDSSPWHLLDVALSYVSPLWSPRDFPLSFKPSSALLSLVLPPRIVPSGSSLCPPLGRVNATEGSGGGFPYTGLPDSSH